MQFAELDELYEAAGAAPEKRLALFENNHDAVSQRDDALAREIALKVTLGKYDDAIRYLTGRPFAVWEGGTLTVVESWMDAHLLRGRQRFAARQAVRARPMDWPDYATLNALSCWPAGPPRRSAVLRVVGQNIVEHSFLELKRDMAEDPSIQAQVLVTARDWPVGWAILKPDAGGYAPYRERRPPMVLDLYAHPNFEVDYPRLLGSVELPADRKVIALIDSRCPAGQEALQEGGFVVEGRLTGVFQWQGQPVDLIYMARNRRFDPGRA
jgi:hypothetical protein